jgi:hypothetical protein
MMTTTTWTSSCPLSNSSLVPMLGILSSDLLFAFKPIVICLLAALCFFSNKSNISEPTTGNRLQRSLKASTIIIISRVTLIVTVYPIRRKYETVKERCCAQARLCTQYIPNCEQKGVNARRDGQCVE